MTSPVFFSMFISVALTCIIFLIPTVYLIYSLLGYYSLIIFPILYYLDHSSDYSQNKKFTQEEYDVAEILANLSNTKIIKEEKKTPKLRRSERINNKRIGKTPIFY